VRTSLIISLKRSYQNQPAEPASPAPIPHLSQIPSAWREGPKRSGAEQKVDLCRKRNGGFRILERTARSAGSTSLGRMAPSGISHRLEDNDRSA
jgi:hypothetical protein